MSVLPTTLVPPETARDVLAFARTLVAAVRARQLYTAEHPAAEAASERLRSAMVQVSGHSGLELGVTPGGLMANGEPLPADQRMSEAAALLHERDILRLRVLHAPAVNEVSDFLHLLGFDGNALRREGGPSRVWENFGYRWLEVDQIDYDLILRDAPAGTVPANGASGRGGGNGHGSAGQDDVWASLVRSIAGGRNTTESAAQKRLVDIARSAESIRELASQASSTHTAPNGAAMAAAQAATVLATFDRLVEAVRTNAPDDLSVAVKNVAKAATELDPALVMRAVGESAESGMGAELTATLGRYFDDSQVARMLARSLAAEGRATGRMAAALSTLTPDADRRDRVVRLAQSMSASTDKPSGLETMWTSLQQFMSGPSDNTYVSDGYSATLEQAETRSHRLTLDVPAELDAWVHTVSSESVRSLSVTLLLDLFALEEQSTAVTETANDLAALACELLLSADLDEALRIIVALQEAGSAGRSARALAARLSLESIATSESLSEMMAMAGDLDDARFRQFVRLCLTLGPGVVRPAVVGFAASPNDNVRRRLRDLLEAFGETALAALGRLTAEEDWPVARAAIQLLGLFASPAAIALLHPIAKGQDLRKAREAVTALIRQRDPAAVKAVARILAVGSREVRHMVVDALAASRDRQASPVLAGLLPQLDAIGDDFELAQRTMTALRVVGDDSAVDSLVRMTRIRGFFAWARRRELRQTAVEVLLHLKTPAASSAVEDLARRGDRQTRRLASAALRGAA
jgi:hypothetical protein